MGISVRRANAGNNRGKFKPNRNWLVVDDYYEVIGHEQNPAITSRHFIRTYTCTTWPDAMRIADDLANERAIDPWRVIALSERRV